MIDSNGQPGWKPLLMVGVDPTGRLRWTSPMALPELNLMLDAIKAEILQQSREPQTVVRP